MYIIIPMSRARTGKVFPWIVRAWICLCLASALATAALSAPANTPVHLTVSAAISLTESLDAIRNLYQRQAPNVSITLNLGASGVLEQQIVQGAPVDIFISAAPYEMNELQAKGLIVPGTRRDLLENLLVLISPAHSPRISSFNDLLQPRIQRIAIANPESVPAGMYAKQTLQYLKLYSQLRPKLILAQDVRQALAYVETGDAEAGIVYLTEARLSNRVQVDAAAPPHSHSPVIYPVAVIKGCRDPEAAMKFIQFLAGPAAREAFKRRGFVEATH